MTRRKYNIVIRGDKKSGIANINVWTLNKHGLRDQIMACSGENDLKTALFHIRFQLFNKRINDVDRLIKQIEKQYQAWMET